MIKRRYNKIKSILAEKGIENRELANMTGHTESTISRWCTNKSQPTIAVLFNVAEKLGVTPCDLLGSGEPIEN